MSSVGSQLKFTELEAALCNTFFDILGAQSRDGVLCKPLGRSDLSSLLHIRKLALKIKEVEYHATTYSLLN